MQRRTDSTPQAERCPVLNPMKIVQLFLVLSLLSICGFAQVTNKRTSRPKCEQFIYEGLRHYFETNEERPAQIVNNTYDLELWESRTQKIVIGNHTVEWIDEVTKNSSRSSVKINGDLITLLDKTTTNKPDGDINFTLDMIGEWDQIKLFNLYNQTLIAISMRPRQCTGLMCGVGAQLWYDVKTKQKTYFGTYRTDSDVKLFRFTNEEAFYVVSTNFEGDPHGVTRSSVVKYELYKLQSNGQFQIQKNQAGVSYFIKHTSFPDMELVRSTVKSRKVRIADSLEQNWLEKILVENQ